MVRFYALVLCLGFLSGCDFDEAVRSLSPSSEKTASNPSLSDEDASSSAGRLQAVSLALEGLQNPKNATTLTPIPFGLIPWARLYGENAGPEEVLRLNDRWLKKIKARETGNFEAEVVNQGKLHLYRALQSIAGQLPEDTLNTIIDSQIQNPGPFRAVALELLMMRAQYLRDFVLTPELESEIFRADLAHIHFEQLDFLRKLPFAEDVGLVITSFMKPEEPVREKLRAPSFQRWMETAWNEIQRRSGDPDGESPRASSP